MHQPIHPHSQGNFGFAGGRIVTRWLPAASEAGAAALHASPPEDILLPMLREDGLRGALWHSAAHEPPEARTTLTLVPRAQLDAAFQQAGAAPHVGHMVACGTADHGGQGGALAASACALRRPAAPERSPLRPSH